MGHIVHAMACYRVYNDPLCRALLHLYCLVCVACSIRSEPISSSHGYGVGIPHRPWRSGQVSLARRSTVPNRVIQQFLLVFMLECSRRFASSRISQNWLPTMNSGASSRMPGSSLGAAHRNGRRTDQTVGRLGPTRPIWRRLDDPPRRSRGLRRSRAVRGAGGDGVASPAAGALE